MPVDSSTGGEPYYGVVTTEVGKDNVPKNPGAISCGLMKE
jgi:hypothetical protein